MSFECFLQTFLKGIVLSFLESVAYYFDIYWPGVTLFTRITVLWYLYQYKDEYQMKSIQNNNELTSFIDRLARGLKRTRALDFLKKYGFNLDAVYQDAICLIAAFCIRLLVDIIRFLVSRNDMKDRWSANKTHVSDTALAFCYLVQILLLFYSVYHFNLTKLIKQDPSHIKKTYGIKALLDYYLYEDSFILLSGFLSIFLMYLMLRSYNKENPHSYKVFFYTVARSSHIVFDTLVRLFCIYYISLLYYLNVSEQISELFVVLFSLIYYNSARNGAFRSQQEEKKDFFKTKMFLKYLAIYGLSLAMEFQMLYLDFELNLDPRLLLISVICECMIFYFLQRARIKKQELFKWS